METFGKTDAETIRDEFSCIPYYYEERDGGAEYDDGSIFTEISIVCGETTEPELNLTLTKLVTKLVSTKLSKDMGRPLMCYIRLVFFTNRLLHYFYYFKV